MNQRINFSSLIILCGLLQLNAQEDKKLTPINDIQNRKIEYNSEWKPINDINKVDSINRNRISRRISVKEKIDITDLSDLNQSDFKNTKKTSVNKEIVIIEKNNSQLSPVNDINKRKLEYNSKWKPINDVNKRNIEFNSNWEPINKIK